MSITYHPSTREEGFSLIEVLVAFFVLTLGLVPILGVGFSSRSLASDITHNLIAANLAQEGVEAVRAIRDGSVIANLPFDTELPAGDHVVTWDADTLTPYSGQYLLISPEGLYNYTTGIATVFQRHLTIEKVSSAELKLTVSVEWKERNRDRRIDLESHLFDWYTR